ncbi:GspH/FimT family pseudopilin [Pseudoxanthomonas beigongshangi]
MRDDKNRTGNTGAGGFTLIELLIALAVLAVALTLAAPSFQDLIARNRVTAAANELVASLQIARTEAIRRNKRVVLCPSTNGTSCQGTDWRRLVMFVDANADGNPGGAGDLVVRDVTASAGGLAIQGSPNVSSNSRIWFAADGLVRAGNPAVRTGRLSVCSTRLPAAENSREVRFAVSRISVATATGTAACSAPSD